jgi:hypothetical protein
MTRLWTPFNRNGKLKLTFTTDPWWKRAWAQLRRQPIWTRVDAMREDEGGPQ